MEKERNKYLEKIQYEICEAYVFGNKSVWIKLKDDLYNSYHLKDELKKKGYKVSIHCGDYDSYYQCKIPTDMEIRWED